MNLKYVLNSSVFLRLLIHKNTINMFIMYVSVFLQTYQHVCRLKQYFTYKYLPKRFITSDKSQEKVANGNFTLLYMFYQSTLDLERHHWISSVSSSQQINAQLFVEPLQQYLEVFTKYGLMY